MEQTDYTYITSRMLTEICKHTEVLRKGLLVILLVLAAALTLFLIPVDNQEIRFTITVLLAMGAVCILMQFICVVIIERRLAAVRSIRRKELAMEAERILSDKQ